MDVGDIKEPSEGEVLIITSGGGFLVQSSVHEVEERLRAEEWASFVLAESGDRVLLRSDKVVAVREGKRARKGSIGFVHRE